MKNKRTRSRGEGSIYERKDGLWCGEAIIEYPDGTKKPKYVYAGSKEKAALKLKNLQVENVTGKLAKPSKLTVNELLDRWLDDVARPQIEDKTYQQYEGIIRNHIKPRIGNLLIQKISGAHIENILSPIEKGASPRNRQITLVVLRQAFGWALHSRNRWVSHNPCDGIKAPKTVKREMNVLSGDQVSKFLSAAMSDRLHALYVVAITTGLRFGELLALYWDDVDLDRGTLSVSHTLQDIAGKLKRKNRTKNGKARLVQLTQRAVAVLKQHQARMFEERNHPKSKWVNRASKWVFCDTQGKELRQPNVTRRSFYALLKRAELPRVRFHDLRHSFATLMLKGGEHPKIVQEMLGHSKVSITLDTYSHVLEGMQESAVARLDERLDSICKPVVNL